MSAGNFIEAPVDWVVQVSWQVSWLVVLVAGLRWAGRGWMSPAWRHALWFPVVLRLALPVAPTSGLSLYRIIPEWQRVAERIVERGSSSMTPTVPARLGTAENAPIPASAGAGGSDVVTTPRRTEVTATARGMGVGPGRDSALPGEGVVGSRLPLVPRQEAVSAAPSERGSDWRRWMGGIWVGGMAGAAGLMLAAYGRLAWRLRRRPELADARVWRIWRECRGIMGVKRAVRLVTAPEVGSPALFGFWRSYLLLPPGLAESFSDAELRHVFLHELAHVRRGDVALSGVLAVLQVVHWFNPLVWWAFGRMRADRELATDALALNVAGEHEATSYGATVIKVLDGAGTAAMAPGLVGILESRREVADRIRRIAAFRPGARWSWQALGVLVAVAVLGLTDARRSGASVQGAESGLAKGAEATGLEAASRWLPAETKGRAVVVEVRDAASGAPVVGAEVFAPNEVAFHGRGSGGPRWVTDAAGRAEIRLGEVPERGGLARVWFAMSVRAKGYAGQGLGWSRENGDVRPDVPERIEVRLRRGGSLGGVIRDAQGRALPGIRLAAWGVGDQFHAGTPQRRGYPEYWRTLGERPSVVTDVEGRWELADVPLDLPNIVVECQRPDGAVQTFVHSREDQNPNLEAGGTPVRLEELRRGTAVMVMTEGHTIRGRVVSPAGKPLAGARVVEAHGVVNLYRDGELRTDAEGRFVLRHRPAREIILTADAPGHALTSRVVPWAGDGATSDVELRLTPLAPLTIRVRDEAGQGLAGTAISVNTMRTEGQVVEFSGRTDGEGKAVWTNAPAAPVVLVATSPTSSVTRKFRVEAGQREVEVRLRRGMDREVVVRGRVLDARSGAPLKVSAAWVLTKPWQAFSNETAPAMEPETPIPDGFEVRVASSHWSAGGMYPSYRVKIRVPRYGVWLSAERDFDEGDWDLTVRLERDAEKKPILVRTADGQPAAGARVQVQSSESHWLHLMELDADLGVLRGPRDSADFDFDADAEGRVTLPESLFDGGVVVTHVSGFASVKRSALESGSELRLQPWGRVEGVVKEGDRTVAGRAVYLNAGETGLNPWMASLRRVTDANGRFEFRTVPPGDAMVSLALERDFGPVTMHRQRPVVVESGRTTSVDIGGVGRPVLGRALGGWDWDREVHVLVLQTGLREPRMARVEDFATIAGFEQARDRWYGERHRYQREQRSHVLKFGAGGAFRAEDVPAGRYELRIVVRKSVSESERAMFQEGPILARYVREVEVPPVAPGRSPDPVDLGDLEVVPEPGMATLVEAAARPGGEARSRTSPRLERFQGRYVLLRLTADWVEGEKDSRAEFEAFQRRQGKSSTWVAATWNLGDGPATEGAEGAEGARESEKAGWVETRLAGRDKVAALDSLGVETLPMNVLFDPKGRELARDARLESLMVVLERRLAQAE